MNISSQSPSYIFKLMSFIGYNLCCLHVFMISDDLPLLHPILSESLYLSDDSFLVCFVGFSPSICS